MISSLDGLLEIEDLNVKSFYLEDVLREVVQEAHERMNVRECRIEQAHALGVLLRMDRSVLKKVCSGILRNAIENTPDEGVIQIKSTHDHEYGIVEFKDFGIGIASQNQSMIFGGFFHTQDTLHYSSKEPYAFNAGGWGTDLLRAKVLSERLGFSISFSSERCRHIPLDSDECVGRISDCRFIDHREECLRSGGSTFALHLPLHLSPTDDSATTRSA
jgi:signal transduction histidine kinase